MTTPLAEHQDSDGDFIRLFRPGYRYDQPWSLKVLENFNGRCISAAVYLDDAGLRAFASELLAQLDRESATEAPESRRFQVGDRVRVINEVAHPPVGYEFVVGEVVLDRRNDRASRAGGGYYVTGPGLASVGVWAAYLELVTVVDEPAAEDTAPAPRFTAAGTKKGRGGILDSKHPKRWAYFYDAGEWHPDDLHALAERFNTGTRTPAFYDWSKRPKSAKPLPPLS